MLSVRQFLAKLPTTRLTQMMLTCTLAVTASVALSGADSWDRFRGPNGSGHGVTINVPASWKASEAVWKTALPAKGHSSPVVWGNNIYLTSAEKETGKRFVMGIDATSGAIKWTHESAGSTFRQHADNSFASATPAIDAQHVYVTWLGPDGSVLQALTHDGKPVWSVELGKFDSQHGSGCSPIVVGDLVIMRFEQEGKGDSYIIGVDAKTGKEQWKLPRTGGKAPCSTPCLYDPTSAQPQLIFTSTLHGMYGLDPATGKVLWDLPDEFKQRCVGSPVIVGGLIIAGDGSGAKGDHIVAVKPPQGPNEKAAVVWQAKAGLPYVTCMLAKDDLLFFVNDAGNAVCIDAATGKEIWRENLGVGTFYGSPILISERIYCVSKRGEVVAFSATKEFKNLGVSDMAEGSFSTPAVAHGRMYIRTFNTLFAVGAK